MPTDAKGNYHINDQRMRASGRLSMKDGMESKAREDGDGKPKEENSETGGKMSVEPNGSGGFKTSDGADHPDHLHAVAHIAHHLSGGDSHHIAHHDGMSHRSHGIHEDGSHEETHDHSNIEDLKSNLGQFFNEEDQEGKPKQEEDGGGEHEPQIGGGY